MAILKRTFLLSVLDGRPNKSPTPYELQNLVGMSSHKNVAEKMRERLIKRMVEAGDAAPTIEPAPEVSDSVHRRVFEHEILE